MNFYNTTLRDTIVLDRINKALPKLDKKILYVGVNGHHICEEFLTLGYTGLSISSFDKAFYWLENQLLQRKELPKAIICDFELQEGNIFNFFTRVSSNRYLGSIPFIVLAKSATRQDKIKALKHGIDDFYEGSFSAFAINERIEFLQKFKQESKSLDASEQFSLNSFLPTFRMPILKRGLDILISGTLLLLASPILLLIALAIRLESKGPIFYISKRAGTGYHIFDFYKFRSMRVGADKELKKIQHLNQYGGENSSFVKIENDPRITRLGKILRDTSLDELPQLFNVLKGDMSLVGNRPLPLYEAETLTRDQWAKRFLAPAGITGLWQVTKRGKGGDMSEEERMELDIAYADKNSFWYDMVIMAKTVPALFQKDSV